MCKTKKGGIAPLVRSCNLLIISFLAKRADWLHELQERTQNGS